MTSIIAWLRLFIRTSSAGLVFVLRSVCAPSTCAACDVTIPFGCIFCKKHAAEVERAPEAIALRCGAPTGGSEPATRERGALEKDGAATSLSVHAHAFYSKATADAICRFKYGDRPDLSFPLGQLLRSLVRERMIQGDVVVPVPLHSEKLRQRGYNQSALLAAVVASEIGAAFSAQALVRTRATQAQASLDREGRTNNVMGSMRVTDKTAIQGKVVVLVDDVATTGSTLAACQTALLAAGAKRVVCVVLAASGSAQSGVKQHLKRSFDARVP